MKILLCSHFFAPSVGGIEMVSECLAREFVCAGHEVRVVTQTPSLDDSGFDFPIFRRPSLAGLFAQIEWADVVFHNNISLQTAWPLAFRRKPWVVAHHTWLQRMHGARGWQDVIKLRVITRATNIAASQALAARLQIPCRVIRNPYRDDLFRRADVPKSQDLIFAGRLVSDKGCDLCVEALGLLAKEGIKPRLTVCGAGPEEGPLRKQVAALDLESQVVFKGAVAMEEMARMFNAHRYLVIPSRWEEPYGMVAIEALACGCIPVAANGGGLPEAVGDCGRLFERGDAADLANTLREVLSGDGMSPPNESAIQEHLAKHSASAAARAYLEAFESALE